MEEGEHHVTVHVIQSRDSADDFVRCKRGQNPLLCERTDASWPERKDRSSYKIDALNFAPVSGTTAVRTAGMPDLAV